MLQTKTELKAAAAGSLRIFHDCVQHKDPTQLASIVHPDAVFRSPVAHQPYFPAPALLLALQTALSVFEEFVYHREFISEDGQSVALEFSARVGDKELKGADFIRFDDDGKIVEFEVMVRPASGLQALGMAMGKKLGDKVAMLKGGG